MKQTQVGVHPLLSATVIAGMLGLAGYGQTATYGETAGLPGFIQAADQETAPAGATLDIARSATILTKVEAKPEGNRIALVLTGNGTLSPTVKILGDRRMILDMPHVQADRRQSQLRIGHSLLTRVRFGHYPDKVRLVLDLPQSVEHVIDSSDGRLSIMLTPKTVAASNESVPAEVGLTPSPDQWVERAEAAAERRSASPLSLVAHKLPKTLLHIQPIQLNAESFQKDEKKTDTNEVVNGPSRFMGRRISLDFQQADISNVLRLIAEVSGFNIVVGEGVKSKVTMKLANVPWDQALDMLLKMNALGM
ncbi:MAG TPA: AMIN domain-containing protein, partial [Nitrospira sp.]|nr:AMIN domain-containing protein [Nitrospira sp.]